MEVTLVALVQLSLLQLGMFLSGEIAKEDWNNREGSIKQELARIGAVLPGTKTELVKVEQTLSNI